MSWIERLGVALVFFCSLYGQQQSPCDPKPLLLINPNDPAPYKLRGDRCEGVYDPQRSGGPALTVSSYITAFDTYDAEADNALRVRWRAPANSASSPLHVRGYSIATLPSGRQYQMDLQPSVGASHFDLPLQIIRDVKLQRPNLAMIAWTSLKVGPSLREVYVPLEITRASHANTSIEELPQITIVPGRPLDEVYVTVELLGDDLRTVRTLVTKQKVRDIKYPAKLPRPFSFPANIPRPIFLPPIGVTGPGFYSITLSADETDGPPVTNDPVILYYARP